MTKSAQKKWPVCFEHPFSEHIIFLGKREYEVVQICLLSLFAYNTFYVFCSSWMYPFLNMYEPGDYKVVISLFFFLYLCGTLCSVICYFIFSPTVDKYSCGYYIRVTDSTATLDSWSKSESGVVPSQITRAIADAKMHESQVDRSFFLFVTVSFSLPLHSIFYSFRKNFRSTFTFFYFFFLPPVYFFFAFYKQIFLSM